jgi:molecular chaperone DnaK
LSDEEIQRMVKDAEANAAEDKRLHELVSARNQAENMIHTIGKSLNDLGDKVSAEDKVAIEKAIEDLRQVLKGDDKEAIETKTNTLLEISGKIAQQAYGAAGGNPDMGDMGGGFTDAAEAAAAAAAYSQQTNQQSKQKDAGNVVDAEFEEVKDKK